MLEFHSITLDKTLRILRKNSESKKSDFLEELRIVKYLSLNAKIKNSYFGSK
jgi:hypothetical protein